MVMTDYTEGYPSDSVNSQVSISGCTWKGEQNGKNLRLMGWVSPIDLLIFNITMDSNIAKGGQDRYLADYSCDNTPGIYMRRPGHAWIHNTTFSNNLVGRQLCQASKACMVLRFLYVPFPDANVLPWCMPHY